MAWRTRAARELREFSFAAAYLFVCFGALIMLKSAVLRGHGLSPLPLGFALVKALLMAKFMMVGQALHLGERYRERPLVWSILYRASVFLLLLLTLAVLEAVVAGWLHGRPAAQSLHGMGGGTMYEAAATSLVLLLILLPYFAARALAEALGPRRLRHLLFGGGRELRDQDRTV